MSNSSCGRRRTAGALLLGALAIALVRVAPLGAQELADWYPGTLRFGTGLINTPVAWVAPGMGAFWLTASGTTISGPKGADLTLEELMNTNIALDSHWFGRVSLGLSGYSQDPQWGFFGQALLLRDNELSVLPALAVGVRNVGKYRREDRLLVAYDRNGLAPYASGFETSPTVYAVATKSAVLGGARASFSVGYGNGLFSDDGGLGAAYNRRGQVAKGLFFGSRVLFNPAPATNVTVMAENDGWDWNAGVVASWHGVSLGLYGTELEEGGKSPDKGPLYGVYNYAKFNVSLGYSTSIGRFGSGLLLRTRVSDLEREQQRLRTEIGLRERRIASLEASLREAQAGELAQVLRRREELEAQLQAERDAIRRAEERLRQLQQGQQPTTPPSTTPPSTTPPSPPPGSPPGSR